VHHCAHRVPDQWRESKEKSEKESEREEESAFLHFLHFKATSTDVYGHHSLTGAQPTSPPNTPPPPPYFYFLSWAELPEL